MRLLQLLVRFNAVCLLVAGTAIAQGYPEKPVTMTAALADSLRATRVREILVNSGAEAAGTLPDELARFLRDEMAKWGKVIQAAGIKSE